MKNDTINIPAPDLTLRPPRSPRARLGNLVLLPRMLDKGRADLVGKNGEYHYACPLDQHLIDFLGLDADALKAELATGKGDGEILAWIEANGTARRSAWEIATWSTWRDSVAPSDVETRDFVNGLHRNAGAAREDIATFADLLDLDDYVSFGGKA